MKMRYFYMKFVGLLLVLVGFSYSITSFNNFFSYIFRTKIFSENLNIILAVIGLIIPLYIFLFGIYFYFYTDFNITKINKFIFISNIILLIIAILMILFNQFTIFNNLKVYQVFEFIHISLGYVLIILCFMGIYGCIKYKY